MYQGGFDVACGLCHNLQRPDSLSAPCFLSYYQDAFLRSLCAAALRSTRAHLERGWLTLETPTVIVPVGFSDGLLSWICFGLSLLMKQTRNLLAAVRPVVAASLSPHEDEAFLAAS